LFAEYDPLPPNANFDDPDWGKDNNMHYDLKVEKIGRDKYRKFDWDPDSQVMIERGLSGTKFLVLLLPAAVAARCCCYPLLLLPAAVAARCCCRPI
jgi:hypothetical protein